jgi:hypothetical protein
MCVCVWLQEKAFYGTFTEFIKTKHQKLDEDMWRAIFFQVGVDQEST